MIDAENLLNDDDAALGLAGRIGAIGAELEIIRRCQCEMLTQDVPPVRDKTHPRGTYHITARMSFEWRSAASNQASGADAGAFA
jgi:hypothetical protein